MSEAIEIKDMKRDDRIRATHENGDVVEFTVEFSLGTDRYVYATNGLGFCADDPWAFEKITPPLPTKPGFYRCQMGGLWFQGESGKWTRVTEEGGFYMGYSGEDVARVAPLRRVEVPA